MKLNVDHAFHIGEQHLRQGKPNQDYALSGALENGLHYGIVSDGCSSGGETDIGARLVSLALKQALASGPSVSIVDRAQVYLDSMQCTLHLANRDLLATGMLVMGHESQFVSTLVLGDGLVVEQSMHGTLYVHKYEWSDNMPYYLAYALSGRSEFLAREPVLTEEFWSISGPDDWQYHRTVERSTFEATREGTKWSHEPPRGPWDLASIAIISDGALQVDNLPWQRVVWELMHFKSTNGRFAARRMNRFLSEAKTRGRGPLDDIAMAVIHFST